MRPTKVSVTVSCPDSYWSKYLEMTYALDDWLFAVGTVWLPQDASLGLTEFAVVTWVDAGGLRVHRLSTDYYNTFENLLAALRVVVREGLERAL